MNRRLRNWIGVILLSGGALVCAQDTQTAAPAEVGPVSSCVQPPPLVGWQDYNGPFAKVVGTFGRKLERKAVHPLQYKPGVMLCSLEPGAKFLLFLQDSIDPASMLGAGFNAGLDQASNKDPTFEQGGSGYARRFGANFAAQTTSRFFGDFLYPTIFSEDPRYYRMAHGSRRTRLLHAISHTIVARRDNGNSMFNFTEWLGTASSVALNNVYHPGNQPGAAAAARNGAFSLLQDMGFDVLREFWPEVARKFKMPFRGVREE
ncbi:MAG: hypothetical protein LAO55_10530 [Acidobacteriia bacterium]|nr:hypothetical protein [Terriglobia bacterium]